MNALFTRNHRSLTTGWLSKFVFSFLLILILLQNVFATDETFPTGAFIVNMGVTSQTIGNGLKPYGMVYDLMKNYGVNVRWVIKETKVAKTDIDFSHNGVDFRGSAFIITANSRTTAVNAAIASWVTQGVVGITTTSSLTVDVDYVLKVAPKWVLDKKNGKIAEDFFKNAGIPASAHGGSNDNNWKDPADLNSCDDIFVMPHADPTWETHSNLYDWNKDYKGAIWAGCHAVSVLESLKNPANTIQLNFLTTGAANSSTAGLVLFGSHGDPNIPYVHNIPGDPVAQYMGITDDAQTNGSEQVYLPKIGGGWLASTKIITNATSLKTGSINPGPAVINAYGRAFGDASRGQVMYQAGHDIDDGGANGTVTARVAAQRAFFNWSFLAIIDKAPNLALTFPPGASEFVGANAQIQLGAVSTTPGITYEWSSSCGGSFSNAAIANPIYTAPNSISNIPCLITCKVTDACGRETFVSRSITIVAPITFSGSVFNDVAGLTNSRVDGVKIGKLATQPSVIPLYVNISDASNNVVYVATVDPTTGNYSWSTSFYNNEDYKFSLSTVQATIGQPRPVNPTLLVGNTGDTWVNIGEHIGNGDGNDGDQNGAITVSISGAGISEINFGIQIIPVAGHGSNSAVNINGAAQINVPLSTFTNLANSSDVAPGEVKKIIITGMPVGATSIVINGTKYDAGNPIPLAGVEIQTNTAGLPIAGTTITIDPTLDGATSVTIPFVAVDAALSLSVNSGAQGKAVITFSGPLPVKLTSFTAYRSEATVNLQWRTAEEENFSHFEVQRSSDSKTFDPIGFVTAHEGHYYDLTDKKPLSGLNYYRLKMVDADGSFAFSRIQSVELDRQGKTVIYPNPVAGKLTISGNGSIGMLKISDQNGKIVIESKFVSEISVDKLNVGVYILQIIFDDQSVENRKFVVNR